MDFKTDLFSQLQNNLEAIIEDELAPKIAEANQRVSDFRCPVHGLGQSAKVMAKADISSDLSGARAVVHVEACCRDGQEVAEQMIGDLFSDKIIVNVESE